MKTNLKKAFSLVLILCLAVTLSATVFAESGIKRTAPNELCPSCRKGTIYETIIPNFIKTYPVKHLRHIDYEHWEVRLRVYQCDTCGYREEYVLQKLYLRVIDCPGAPR